MSALPLLSRDERTQGRLQQTDGNDPMRKPHPNRACSYVRSRTYLRSAQVGNIQRAFHNLTLCEPAEPTSGCRMMLESFSYPQVLIPLTRFLPEQCRP